MGWFFYALIAATLFSGSVLTDKFLLTRYFKNVSTLTLTAAAALAGAPFLIVFILLFNKLPDARTFITGLTAGWMLMAAYQIYYVALKKADTALISTLFQLILPFNFIIGITYFNEQPKIIQIVGLVIVGVASIIISLDEKEKKWSFRADTLLMMAGASLLVSLSDAVFKFGAENSSFMSLAISEYFSTLLAGIIIIVVSKKVRRELKKLRKNISRTTGVLGFNEGLTLGGTLALRYALVIGPIALVQGVLSAQPLITVIMVAVLSFFGLKINEPRGLQKRTFKVVMEISAVILVCVGSAMLSGVF
jgi:drug/metabolite transporter (DMT)-like permease